MTTKSLQARHVHAGDKLVVGGERDELRPGGKRVALPVCEKTSQNGGTRPVCKEGDRFAGFGLRDTQRVCVLVEAPNQEAVDVGGAPRRG
jgi:hypothetical protein